jgi:hypothetical protein
MMIKYLSLLTCPQCESILTNEKQSYFLQWINCECCQTSTPVVYGFVLFTESVKLEFRDSEIHVDRLIGYFKPNSRTYQDYIAQKQARNVLEIYAALQPFNESTRSIFPFLSKLKEMLKPDDLIIDTYSRTGWHALLLSGLFPQQQIISVWDSNNGVLGYSGYGYWFSQDKKPQNLDIIFAAPEERLPFSDNSAKLVIAHDILHRRELEFYADELLRICDRDGVIIAPHIHLNNRAPDPYFDRGGTIRHGDIYSNYYNHRLANTSRQCLVLSEIDLFNHQDNTPLQNQPDGKYCNGLLAIAKKSWLEQNFTNDLADNIPSEHAHFIPNPLLEVDPIAGYIQLKPNGLGGKIRYYLDRHPVYEQRIQPILGKQLDRDGIELLIASQKTGTIIDYAHTLGWSISHTQNVAQILQKHELIVALPIANIAVELQNFHTNQHSLLPSNFRAFWQNSIDTAPNRILLTLDGESLTVSEIHQLMLAICGYYIANGCDRINSIGQIEIDRKLDRTQQLILMMSAWWMSMPIIDSQNQISISRADNLLVVDRFWEIIELYLDVPVKLEDLSQIDRQQTSQINWYEMLPLINQGSGQFINHPFL